ncbi:MAG: leucine-rich repeat protein [Alistipes sp.]|nr:leucine-rich repeat protein [Alistipes sp.]
MLRVILNTIFCAVLFVGCEKEVNDERLRVTPSNIEIGCEGGTVQVDIESTSGWEVIVESDCTWVKSDRYESEVGRRQWIKLTISKNNTENTRNTTITIRNSGQSRDITITQTPISLNISPESIDASQEKTTKDISINSNISWSAKSSDSWITISKSSGDVGYSKTTITIAKNTTGIARTGYVDISNSEYNISRRINIQQNGYTPTEYCIEYTSTSQITIDTYAYYGAMIESHTWNNGNGVIRFDGPVTSIGNKAFFDCSSLTSITIPERVTSIGDFAFHGCSSLTSINIPNSVTSIGEYAFEWCSSLTSINIPNSVTSIGHETFAYCESLTSITIGNGVTSIGYGAFAYCSSLKSITIPNSVTSIGGSAFYNCSSLTSITIPESVTSIGSEAFAGCSSLISLTIPNSVTGIGDYAFYDCSNLTSITIPESVTSIGYGAFSYCNSLTSVYCKATTPPALDIDVFAGNGSGRKIYVPRNSVNAYKSAEGWNDYAWHIVGYDF